MKVCLNCNSSTNVFLYSRGNVDKRNNYCKMCTKTTPLSILVFLGNKICSCCKKNKSRTDFYPVNRNNIIIAVSSECKLCTATKLDNYNNKRRYYPEKNTIKSVKRVINMTDSYIKTGLLKTKHSVPNNLLIAYKYCLTLKRIYREKENY